MEQKLYLVYLNKDYRIQFKKINSDLEIDYLTIRNKKKPINQLYDDIFNFPSTNGLYTLYGFENDDKVRFHISTEYFKNKCINDEFIDTMIANPNLFYRGKRVNIKTFIKKQLLRAMVPSKFNDIERKAETYDDIVRIDLSKLSVSELKDMLSNRGYPYSGRNKSQLIDRLLNALKK